MNFGESLAYWYFRLNGFLPMANFVLHRPDAPRRHNADSDLLAVSFPYVFEEIGGQQDDWDNERFNDWGIDHLQSTVCVIAEIKTGEYREADIKRAFDKQRVVYALRRAGIFARDQWDGICQELENHELCVCEQQQQYCFAKVLISNSEKKIGQFQNTVPHLHLELDDAVGFIRDRMRKYPRDKNAARMFFPGDLIQFFAWEAGLEPHED